METVKYSVKDYHESNGPPDLFDISEEEMKKRNLLVDDTPNFINKNG